MFLKGEFSNRLVQVSLFAGIVYYITAYPVVFESARKYFPIKFKKTHHLLIFHTFVFAVLMYLLTYFVFDPIVRVVEGSTGGDHGNNYSEIEIAFQDAFKSAGYKDLGCFQGYSTANVSQEDYKEMTECLNKRLNPRA